MIMSNEPGMYRDGQWGIRIENTMVSKLDSDNRLYFDTISYFPIQTNLINETLLSHLEMQWLQQYLMQCKTVTCPSY